MHILYHRHIHVLGPRSRKLRSMTVLAAGISNLIVVFNANKRTTYEMQLVSKDIRGPVRMSI
jgi:hypothetical protein